MAWPAIGNCLWMLRANARNSDCCSRQKPGTQVSPSTTRVVVAISKRLAHCWPRSQFPFSCSSAAIASIEVQRVPVIAPGSCRPCTRTSSNAVRGTQTFSHQARGGCGENVWIDMPDTYLQTNAGGQGMW